MAWRIYYTISHVNKAWEKQVKEAKYLSETQKQDIIKQAHRDVMKENAKEIALIPLKVIGVIALNGLVYLIGYWLGIWR